MSCSEPDCDLPVKSRGMCKAHYLRWYHQERKARGKLTPSLEERFWAKVDKTDGCWNWVGATDGKGYGIMRHKPRLAHRISYFLAHGELPPVLDHLCRNTLCVNPSHLEPVTLRENTLRGLRAPAAINARKTHCKHGHPFSGENLYVNPTNGSRTCITCRNLEHRRARAAGRAS